MTNSEHIKLLKQGVEAWNEWRAENVEIKPDLVKANLSKANLSGARLFKVLGLQRGPSLERTVAIKATICNDYMQVGIKKMLQFTFKYVRCTLGKMTLTKKSGAKAPHCYSKMNTR